MSNTTEGTADGSSAAKPSVAARPKTTAVASSGDSSPADDVTAAAPGPGDESVDAAAEADAPGSPVRQHDVPASTIVRLMGMPTAGDIQMLEQNIGALSRKVTNLSLKIDRMTEQMLELFHDIDRTNVQFGDLREFLKNILGAVMANTDGGGAAQAQRAADAMREQGAAGDESSDRAKKSTAKILSSE
ncbi:MAG: hypothetical protein KDD44_08430 [Bdellovibrionales bacterium]|nr:hypothetical protein [Bdellovibrionales bacterium]